MSSITVPTLVQQPCRLQSAKPRQLDLGIANLYLNNAATDLQDGYNAGLMLLTSEVCVSCWSSSGTEWTKVNLIKKPQRTAIIQSCHSSLFGYTACMDKDYPVDPVCTPQRIERWDSHTPSSEHQAAAVIDDWIPHTTWNNLLPFLKNDVDMRRSSLKGCIQKWRHQIKNSDSFMADTLFMRNSKLC